MEPDDLFRGDVSQPFRSQGLGLLGALPDHLVNAIILKLQLIDVVALQCTSKCMRVFASEEAVWQQLALSGSTKDGLLIYKVRATVFTRCHTLPA